TVTDRAEVDRALVWNGSSWGNAVQLDSNTGHNITDANVVYEQKSGRAMVVYATGTTGSVGYQIWNGTSWTPGNTPPATPVLVPGPPAGTNGFAQWTVLAADPNSNRIAVGVQTQGNDAWMNVWSGTAWNTATLGISNGVTAPNNLGIAVAFE